MIFSAYARGVNAYIDQHRDHLPLEFRILRYQPKVWTVTDSVLVAISMSQLLNPQYGMEYWREKIGQKLSPELMADLYPFSSPRDHPPGQDLAKQQGWAQMIPPVEQNSREAAIANLLSSFAPEDSCESCLPVL